MKCRARRISDQMVCHICGYVWDACDPDPPLCKPAEEAPHSVTRTLPSRVSAEQARAKIHQMLTEQPEDVT